MHPTEGQSFCPAEQFCFLKSCCASDVLPSKQSMSRSLHCNMEELVVDCRILIVIIDSAVLMLVCALDFAPGQSIKGTLQLTWPLLLPGTPSKIGQGNLPAQRAPAAWTWIRGQCYLNSNHVKNWFDACFTEIIVSAETISGNDIVSRAYNWNRSDETRRLRCTNPFKKSAEGWSDGRGRS